MPSVQSGRVQSEEAIEHRVDLLLDGLVVALAAQTLRHVGEEFTHGGWRECRSIEHHQRAQQVWSLGGLRVRAE